ncbi:barstar family protein [Aestuariimicrobium soli]|uniref:barstar family protein n=1 Tax=Aestuariimicrobium soli TaxID=2035834 RepID=UPI003EBBB97E
MITVTLEGSRITDLAGLYAEVNAQFMAEESWQLGPSLDALNDLLHGGIGLMAAHPDETLRVVWHEHATSRAALGFEDTRDWYREKLARPGFNRGVIEERLAELEAGTGPTYFDLVLQVFADHAPERGGRVELVLD